MINFNYVKSFNLDNENILSHWISKLITLEGFKEKEINFIFCDDDYLHQLNVDFLNHDTLTDVISFDYTIGKSIQGDIYISIERVKENALKFKVSFSEELSRVMFHGVLHFCGYKDKSTSEINEMRSKENFYLQQLK